MHAWATHIHVRGQEGGREGMKKLISRPTDPYLLMHQARLANSTHLSQLATKKHDVSIPAAVTLCHSFDATVFSGTAAGKGTAYITVGQHSSCQGNNERTQIE
jgi:hypothetical protein